MHRNHVQSLTDNDDPFRVGKELSKELSTGTETSNHIISAVLIANIIRNNRFKEFVTEPLANSTKSFLTSKKGK